jgi:hypothetical protein
MKISVHGLLPNPELGATMMGQSERKVAVPRRIVGWKIGESRMGE